MNRVVSPLTSTCVRSTEGFTRIVYDQLAAEFPDADPVKLREVAILKFAGEKAIASGAWEDVVRLRNLAIGLKGVCGPPSGW